MTRENLDDLVEVVHKHLCIIESAFPNLLEYVDFTLIKKEFLQDIVLNKQGWEAHKLPLPSGSKAKEILLSLNTLQNRLENFSKESLTPTVGTPLPPVSNSLAFNVSSN